jgi:hypothetical protein
MKLFILLISVLFILNSSSQENMKEAEFLHFEALELHRLHSNSAGNEPEITAIKKLLMDESTYAAKRDFANWSSCWVHSGEAVFTYIRADATVSRFGFDNIASVFNNTNSFLPEINCKNYYFLIGENSAFVSYDQTDNWGEEPGETKKQTRTLIKKDGQWKILHKTVVVASSFKYFKN